MPRHNLIVSIHNTVELLAFRIVPSISRDIRALKCIVEDGCEPVRVNRRRQQPWHRLSSADFHPSPRSGGSGGCHRAVVIPLAVTFPSLPLPKSRPFPSYFIPSKISTKIPSIFNPRSIFNPVYCKLREIYYHRLLFIGRITRGSIAYIVQYVGINGKIFVKYYAGRSRIQS